MERSTHATAEVAVAKVAASSLGATAPAKVAGNTSGEPQVAENTSGARERERAWVAASSVVPARSAELVYLPAA